MPRRGRSRKKSRTHVDDAKNAQARSALKDDEGAKVPRSIVFRRGKKRTEPEVGELVHDVRHLMAPYTALNLQENKQLTLSHYAKHLALPMGVSHMLSFSQNDDRLWLKLVKTPDGPTLTFRVLQFTLHRHIAKTQRRPVALNTPALQLAPPIVVTNNFESAASAPVPVPVSAGAAAGAAASNPAGSGSASASASPPHLKLMRITFQNLFPPTNVYTVQLRDCRRVALFQYDAAEDVVHVRHYAVRTSPVGGGGANRRLRRLASTAKAPTRRRKLPNLGKLADIADYLDHPGASGNGYVSDSAASSSLSLSTHADDNSDSDRDESGTPASSNAVVRLPDRFQRGSSSSPAPAQSNLSAIKLQEIGPRLTLKLVKVERGMAGGDVLYHALQHKSPEEAAMLKQRKQKQVQLKAQRKAEQQRNVDKKRKVAEEKREQKAKRKRVSGGGVADDDDDDGREPRSDGDEESDDE
jgi:ribosome biogenesis protein SSF1/2